MEEEEGGRRRGGGLLQRECYIVHSSGAIQPGLSGSREMVAATAGSSARPPGCNAQLLSMRAWSHLRTNREGKRIPPLDHTT